MIITGRNTSSIAILAALLVLVGISTPSKATDSTASIKIKGDLRYRHEMIDNEGKDARHRHRIRARFAVEAKVNDDLKAAIQLATGSDDPVSTNQTLDDAFSTKNIGVDLAYFEYEPSQLEGLQITGGKFKNPFFKPGKSELIWDSDWNPEGGTIKYDYDNENLGFTLIGAGLWIDEDSKNDDVSLASGQGIVRLGFDEKNSSIAVGGAYFMYYNISGHVALYEIDDAKGNSVDRFFDTTFYTTINGDTAIGNVKEYHVYQNDYELIELFLELNHKFDKIPITVMFDYVTNSAADSLNTGWLAGVRAGKAKKTGSWEFRYIYREVEKDAVLGAFVDSDFRGGGTNARGHEIGGAYQLMDNTAFMLTYFMNEIGIDRSNAEDYQRLQVDLQLTF